MIREILISIWALYNTLLFFIAYKKFLPDNKKIKSIITTCIFIVFLLLSLLNVHILYRYLIIGMSIIIIMYFSTSKFKVSILYTLLFIQIISASISISVSNIGLLFNVNLWNIQLRNAIILLLFHLFTETIGVIILKKAFNSLSFDVNELINWTVLLPYIVTLVIVVFLEDSISNSDNKLFITSIIFLIGILILINSNFMCLGMVEKYLSSKKIELEEEMNIAQIKLQYDYYKNREEDMIHVRRIYHDMKNHLLILNSRSIENLDLVQYGESLLDQINKIETYIDTGNKFLDIILNDKYKKALKYNISIDIDANLKLANWIDDFDLCTLFGNLLDNAIEASIKEEESKRYINVRAKVIKSFLTISVENNTVEGEEIDFVSRKDDQENHGYGMKNIKNVINKYGGEMTFETNNSCISIFVMLNKV